MRAQYSARSGPRWAAWAGYGALALLLLLSLPFVLYAVDFGWRGLTRDLSATSYLFAPDTPWPNAAIALHMLAGAAITFLAPLQLVPVVRVRLPAIHRASGYVIATLALVAALAGLTFIALRGTIGGLPMDVAFAVYGILVATTAVQAVRYARAGDYRTHRRWALRLFVLAIASWLFRLHYALWFLATGGAGSTEDLTGPFDRVQLLAFYLPYLLLLELWFRREDAASAA